MPSKIIRCKDHEEASRIAAQLMAEAFAASPRLCATFAAGDTPLAAYRVLIARQKQGGPPLGEARYIGLDEWVGLGPKDPGSCAATMGPGFYGPAGIPPQNIFAFNGLAANPAAEAARMDAILDAHPLDLAVLGVGVNGHVGFNEPELALESSFSLAPLSEVTRQVGRKYFSGRPTPSLGATTTLNALQRAERVILIATGESKRGAMEGVLAGSSALPVGAFLNHPGAVYLVDEAAWWGG